MRAILFSTAIGILALLVMTAVDQYCVRAQVTAGDRHAWKTYTNVRFQYSICYPEDLLAPQGESDNSDGQKFTGKDGAQLIVFGRNNVLNQSLKEIMKESSSSLAGESGKVTYAVMKPKWFVISGVNGPSIFYAKTFFTHDQFKSFELTYSKSTVATYKPLVGRLGACFTDLVH